MKHQRSCDPLVVALKLAFEFAERLEVTSTSQEVADLAIAIFNMQAGDRARQAFAKRLRRQPKQAQSAKSHTDQRATSPADVAPDATPLQPLKTRLPLFHLRRQLRQHAQELRRAQREAAAAQTSGVWRDA